MSDIGLRNRGSGVRIPLAAHENESSIEASPARPRDQSDGGRRHRVFSAQQLAELADRFWSKVDRENGPIDPVLGRCWPWTGALAVNGYGQWHPYARVHVPAHRFATMLRVGRTLEFREVVMHLCRLRTCCRPAHHKVGSHRLNNWHTAALDDAFNGEKNGQAKLTAEIVLALRTRAAADIANVRSWLGEEAQRLGLRPGHLRSCINGRAWSHLPGAVTLRKPQSNRHAHVVREVSEFLGTPVSSPASQARVSP